MMYYCFLKTLKELNVAVEIREGRKKKGKVKRNVNNDVKGVAWFVVM